jgi:hypothetical protein
MVTVLTPATTGDGESHPASIYLIYAFLPEEIKPKLSPAEPI